MLDVPHIFDIFCRFIFSSRYLGKLSVSVFGYYNYWGIAFISRQSLQCLHFGGAAASRRIYYYCYRYINIISVAGGCRARTQKNKPTQMRRRRRRRRWQQTHVGLWPADRLTQRNPVLARALARVREYMMCSAARDRKLPGRIKLHYQYFIFVIIIVNSVRIISLERCHPQFLIFLFFIVFYNIFFHGANWNSSGNSQNNQSLANIIRITYKYFKKYNYVSTFS